MLQYNRIIKETVEKITHHSPSEMQTGPAKRGDQTTIELHLKYLEKNYISIGKELSFNLDLNKYLNGQTVGKQTDLSAFIFFCSVNIYLPK